MTIKSAWAQRILSLSLILSFVGATSAQESSLTGVVPAGFKSDGCSMFPDGCYRDCCVEHDLAYFMGGSREERKIADKRLMQCVTEKKGFHHQFVGRLMWLGVRIGGTPYLPTPFRWGFGEEQFGRSLSEKR